MKQTELKIGLVENDDVFANQTIKLLKTIPKITEIYRWESAETFWRDKKGLDLQIIFLDILLPGMGGVELAGMISERNPEIQKIMLSNMNSDEMIFQSLRNGSVGYILKSELKDIGDVIDTVMKGGAIITPTIAFRVLDSFKQKKTEPEIRLTEKEKQILDQMIRGKTIHRVAEFLGVSSSAVQFHVKNIYIKLNVHNRAEMVKKAGDIGLY